MHKISELAFGVVSGLPADGARWMAQAVSDSKLRTFIAPGDQLEFEARLAKHEDASAVVAVEARKGNRVAGGARVSFTAERRS